MPKIERQEYMVRQKEKIKKSLFRWTEKEYCPKIKEDFILSRKTEDMENILLGFIVFGVKNEEYVYYPPRPTDKLAEIIKKHINKDTKYEWVQELDGRDIYRAFEGNLEDIKKWVEGELNISADSKVSDAFLASDRRKVLKEFNKFLSQKNTPRVGTKILQIFTRAEFMVGDEITYNHPVSTFAERYRTYDYEEDYFTSTFGNRRIIIEPSRRADTIIDLTDNSAYTREREKLLPPGTTIKVKKIIGNLIYASVLIPTKKELIKKYNLAI